MTVQSFKMAFSSITSNKLRSFLTMLGIIIGVMSVVVLISIVNGTTSSVTSQIEDMGSNLLTVNVRDTRYGSISMSDLTEIEDEYDTIAHTAPVLTSTQTAKAGTNTYSATITGTTPSMQSIKETELASGRYLKTPDIESGTAVAVIGYTVADELFSRQDVVGEKVNIGGRTFKIIGVFTESGETSLLSCDTSIVIPYTTAQHLLLETGVTTFYASAASAGEADAAEEDLNAAMLERMRNDEDAFSVSNQSAILETMESVTESMSLMLGGIAGISLLVGGIGIMNIMLVSVAERTREIGIRKAIGASRKRILLQFLIEALVVSVLGGVIGLLLSVGLLELIQYAADIAYTLSGNVVLLALGFSLLVGVVFGIYPANKAAGLKPIDALRTE
ncbi:MAG: ABC transporter permease [Clostridiales bacterium]|nr:MAG: ABC transporter permease [Clostridiales bacterium]